MLLLVVMVLGGADALGLGGDGDLFSRPFRPTGWEGDVGDLRRGTEGVGIGGGEESWALFNKWLPSDVLEDLFLIRGGDGSRIAEGVAGEGVSSGLTNPANSVLDRMRRRGGLVAVNSFPGVSSAGCCGASGGD